MDKIAIKVNQVDKIYRIYRTKSEKYLDFFLPKKFGMNFYALRKIDFSVEKGDSVGLIGLNGSGKTTLANLIAGCSAVSHGEIITKGKVSMISVSAGMDTRLTGIENIMQKGLLLGLSHGEIQNLTPQIIEFAGLGQFIFQQVKTYSSGMRAKLGFAIAVNIDPDILIIDEALSVGDPTFTEKCLKKMYRFREKGKTIIFVSHSMEQVKKFCNKAVWLYGGEIREIGECEAITENYAKFIKEYNNLPYDEKNEMLNTLRQAQFVSL